MQSKTDRAAKIAYNWHILKSLDANMRLLDRYEEVIRELEVYILPHTQSAGSD